VTIDSVFQANPLLKDFPDGCCELASQTLAEYLTEDGSKLHPYIIGMQWEGSEAQPYGNVR